MTISRSKALRRRLSAPFHRMIAFRQLQALHDRNPSLDDVIDQGMRFGRGHYQVHMLQVRSEISSLAREVEKLRPEVILEIGTSRGGTALIWAHLAQSRLITCDILDKGGFADLLRAFPPPGASCRVSVMVGDSHDAAFVARVRRELAGDTVDFLFIDGDHTEAGVARDFADYRGFVRPGGLIAFHDIAERQPLECNQVQHFWKRIRDRYETTEFIEDRAQIGYGIGIVRVPERWPDAA